MAHFADCAQSIVTQVVVNEQIAKHTKRLRIRAPQFADSVVPGQFFMLRIAGCNDPLIGRAFALYDLSGSGDDKTLEVVYLVKGKLTTALDRLGPGDEVAIWGPLGNGFDTQTTEHLIMVAGGIGQTPFLTLAKEALGQASYGNADLPRASGYAGRVTLCYGARTQDYLAGLDDFSAAGVSLRIATEDGSRGRQGRVTDELEQILAESEGQEKRIVCCGPEPMMAAVAEVAKQHGVSCQVSLETPMACGIGICFTCVAKVGTEADWDFKRTCVEGPVFDSREIIWD